MSLQKRGEDNEILVVGFVGGALDARNVCEVEILVNDDGTPYPGVGLRIPGLVKSQYRLTIERIPGTERDDDGE